MTVGWWRRAGLGVVLAAALGAGGCARAQARGNPDGPPLRIPEPPPRVIVVADLPEEPVVETAPAPPPPAAPAPDPAPRAAEPAPKPPPAADAATPPRRPEPRTLGAPGDAARERAVRDRMSAASRDLGRVNYGRLGAAERAQFDQARRFLQQAEQALRDRNLLFSATLADKAATLAADLAR